MARARFRRVFWLLVCLLSPGIAFADGMVFSEVYYPQATIPNQQALIHYSDGIERLVIETSFLGEGTNFAWVVPLPAVPQVKPVSKTFFVALQQTFQPTLVHRVNPYYAGVLLVCGLAFLGSRSVRDEGSWVVDLPLCVLLGVGAGLVGRHAAFGVVTLVLALCVRLCARTPAAYAFFLLIGTTYAVILIYLPNARWPDLIVNMGGDAPQTEAIAGVTVVSIQHAGLFETTTLRGSSPKAVLQWLTRHGYQAPASAEPAIRKYIDKGWVFAASKARTAPGNQPQVTALHPLAFTFPSKTQVYPTMLTATGDQACDVVLYVFGNRRATVPHFSVERCDRLAMGNAPSGLRLKDPDVVELIGASTIGTKLAAQMTPAQMASDVEIGSTFFRRTRTLVYSRTGALVICLNLALPLAGLGWLLIGLSRGGWQIDRPWIVRWRLRTLLLTAAAGAALYLLLPKVEIEIVQQPRAYEDAAWD